ncbi:MAG: lysophospholipid acyltransferase family protein [Bacillota bacterium]
MSKPPIQFKITKKLATMLLNTMVNLDVEGRENIPEDGKFILISNHLNWSDPFLIYSIFPAEPRIVFVAEYEGIYDTTFNRKFIDFMGKPIITIDRTRTHSRSTGLKSMFRVVRSGEILAIFPEGRIGHEEGDLFPFHVGAFSLAKKLGIPVLPLGIAGSKELYFRKPIKINIGELHYAKENESNEDFARRMALTVKDLIPEYPGEGPFPGFGNWMTDLCQGELRPFEGENDLIIPTNQEKNGNGNS